jgi:hypothetical protein
MRYVLAAVLALLPLSAHSNSDNELVWREVSFVTMDGVKVSASVDQAFHLVDLNVETGRVKYKFPNGLPCSNVPFNLGSLTAYESYPARDPSEATLNLSVQANGSPSIDETWVYHFQSRNHAFDTYRAVAVNASSGSIRTVAKSAPLDGDCHWKDS